MKAKKDSLIEIKAIRREYKCSNLRRKSLPNNPLILFSTWLTEACNSNVIDPTAMSLATVDDTGMPYQRIVLLKEFNEKGLIFYTNLNSQKAQHILSNSKVSLLFYWAEYERQIRINGIADKLSNDEVADYFHSRPRESQLVAWSSKQSLPVASRDILQEQYQKVEEKFRQKSIPLPSFWGGFRVYFEKMEFWQGGAHRLHDRFLYQRDSNDFWSIQRLSP